MELWEGMTVGQMGKLLLHCEEPDIKLPAKAAGGIFFGLCGRDLRERKGDLPGAG